MKRVKILLRLSLAAMLFFQSIFSLQAQNTEGREFWVTFGQISDFSTASSVDMRIRIVGGHETTTGKILFTDLGTSHNFIVNPNQINTYVLNNDEKIAVYNTISNGKTNYSIHINTQKSVSVYASIWCSHYNDVTNILPISALGKEYYAISYKPTLATNDAYCVVATQNSTQLYHNGLLAAILNKGQVRRRTTCSFDRKLGNKCSIRYVVS